MARTATCCYLDFVGDARCANELVYGEGVMVTKVQSMAISKQNGDVLLALGIFFHNSSKMLSHPET